MDGNDDGPSGDLGTSDGASSSYNSDNDYSSSWTWDAPPTPDDTSSYVYNPDSPYETGDWSIPPDEEDTGNKSSYSSWDWLTDTLAGNRGSKFSDLVPVDAYYEIANPQQFANYAAQSARGAGMNSWSLAGLLNQYSNEDRTDNTNVDITQALQNSALSLGQYLGAPLQSITPNSIVGNLINMASGLVPYSGMFNTVDSTLGRAVMGNSPTVGGMYNLANMGLNLAGMGSPYASLGSKALSALGYADMPISDLFNNSQPIEGLTTDYSGGNDYYSTGIDNYSYSPLDTATQANTNYYNSYPDETSDQMISDSTGSINRPYLGGSAGGVELESTGPQTQYASL